MDTSQNLKLLNMAKRNVTLSVILVILAVVKISLPLLVPANSDNYLYVGTQDWPFNRGFFRTACHFFFFSLQKNEIPFFFTA